MEEKLIDNEPSGQNQQPAFSSNLKNRMKNMVNTDKLKNMMSKDKFKENFGKLKKSDTNHQIKYKVSRYNEVSIWKVVGLVIAVLAIIAELYFAIAENSII